MKIGILSMQKVLNYGSFLQAYILKQILEVKGHDVYFLDIVPGRQVVPIQAQSAEIRTKLDRFFLKRVENFFLFKKMKKLHISDYTTYLETEKKLPNSKLDVAIIGSDEVFNVATPSPWGFSTQLFGNIPEAKKVVTYAASCGATTFDAVQKYGITDEIKISMSKINNLSVRDDNTLNFVKSIDGRQAEIHVDPVMLGDLFTLAINVSRPRPYLLVYAYSNRISDSREIESIKRYAKTRNLEIISVGMQQRWADHNIAASAFELLGYIRNAKCVVTDTFHGTVFSIKLNKNFATIIRDSNRNKLHALLSQFELNGRELNAPSDLAQILDVPIDYSVVNQHIAEEIERSNKYLDQILKEG